MTTDQPNTDPNPHPLDLEKALLANAGHASLYSAFDKPLIILTFKGIKTDDPSHEVEVQVALKPSDYDGMVAFIERMRARNPGWEA